MREVPGDGDVIEVPRLQIGHDIGEHVRTVHEPTPASPGQITQHTFIEQRPPVGVLKRGEVRIGKLRDSKAIAAVGVARVARVRSIDGYRSLGMRMSEAC